MVPTVASTVSWVGALVGLQLCCVMLSAAPETLQCLSSPYRHHVFAVTLRRYGTHFVSGVGHRGAFIGSITVKLSDVKLAAGASASFKASYKTVSTMAELKTSMEQSLQTSDVTVSDHRT